VSAGAAVTSPGPALLRRVLGAVSRRPRLLAWAFAALVLATSDWASPVTTVVLLAVSYVGLTVMGWGVLTPRGDFGRGWRPVSKASRLLVAGALGLPVVEGAPPAVLSVRRDRAGVVLVTWPTSARPLTVEQVHAVAPSLYAGLGAVRHVAFALGSTWSLTLHPTHPVDALATPTTWAPSPGLCALDAVPVGVREDGRPMLWPVLGGHTLLVGTSGSGKGSVMWSLLLGLAPHVRAGTVELHGVDLKGGTELGLAGPGFFASLAVDAAGALPVLEAVAETMRARLREMRDAGVRLHVPVPGAPLVVLVIDEAAAFGMVLDKKENDRATALLREVLSQGRAAGVSVFAALQDPRKEALAARDLFTRQVALRLRSADEVRMAIGPALYDLGAHCETIPVTSPGTGYALSLSDGGDPHPVRFRATWVPDEAITAVTACPF
jgi:hypothetical protein